MLGAKDVAVEAADPLLPARRDVEAAVGVPNVRGDFLPVELQIFADQIGAIRSRRSDLEFAMNRLRPRLA